MDSDKDDNVFNIRVGDPFELCFVKDILTEEQKEKGIIPKYYYFFDIASKGLGRNVYMEITKEQYDKKELPILKDDDDHNKNVT